MSFLVASSSCSRLYLIDEITVLSSSVIDMSTELRHCDVSLVVEAE
jgi:hypothetical protein